MYQMYHDRHHHCYDDENRPSGDLVETCNSLLLIAVSDLSRTFQENHHHINVLSPSCLFGGILFHISGIVKIACRCQHVPMPFIFFTIDATLTTAMMEGLPLKITTRHLFLCNLHHLLDPSRVWPISQSLALVPLTTSFLALGSLVLGCECAVSYTLASPACQARPLHSYILFTSYSLWPDFQFWNGILIISIGSHFQHFKCIYIFTLWRSSSVEKPQHRGIIIYLHLYQSHRDLSLKFFLVAETPISVTSFLPTSAGAVNLWLVALWPQQPLFALPQGLG